MEASLLGGKEAYIVSAPPHAELISHLRRKPVKICFSGPKTQAEETLVERLAEVWRPLGTRGRAVSDL